MDQSKPGRLRSYEPLLITLHRLVDATLCAGLFLVLSYAYGKYNESLYPPAGAVIFLGTMGLFHVIGIYRSWRGSTLLQEINTLFVGCFFLYGFVLALGFFLKVTQFYSRLVLLTWMVALPVLLAIERMVIRLTFRYFRARGWNFRHVVVAGRGPLAERLIEWLKANPWVGAKVHGFFDDKLSYPLDSVPYLGPLDALPHYVKNNHIDHVYIALPMKAEEKMSRIVRDLADTTVSLYIVPDIFLLDIILSGQVIRLNELALIGIWETPFRGINRILKRAEDIIIASVALTLFGPLMIVIACLIKATSKGPAIFKQWRYGLDGRPIQIYKFRTMTVCEDGYRFKQATQCDPRVTKVGMVLRRLSLDELPQLINVLQGRMSIVGPRPHPVAMNEEYRKKVRGYMLRHKVRPGITGLAQVNGYRGETDTLDKMEKRIAYDLEYLRNWSVLLDLKILALTLLKGFRSPNAY
ncbi:MAG: undecaprenyl-phosphate glucose phosphotransferase [Deltaproteobacteria bacterium]|nr:undecaprenyl-phosphate glucose phosphotransferase [Deltaproteobacteria bacterium]